MVDDCNHFGDFQSSYWLPTRGPRLGYYLAVAETPYPNGLAACMARAKINDPKLAAAVGTTRQQIHKLRHGERKLTVQWAKILAPHLDCTWQELIEGPHDPFDTRRDDLLAVFDTMDDRDRDTLLRIAQSLRRDEPPNALPPPDGVSRLRRVGSGRR